ncbi:MAG: 23S rRNA (cytidine(2498)-2'-O)-methyltransferase RlmM [Moraxellaceae bacterium]|nr:23S rRNA (cytidine(2498)-2'-O)-methyltransferase RlmM [Moraxellaceae bacterium]
MSTPGHALLLYCRAGFENECAAEANHLAGEAGLSGYARVQPDSGFVRFTLQDSLPWDEIAQRLPWNDWVFPRQRVVLVARVDRLPAEDRVKPILDAVKQRGIKAGKVWFETADTNEAKELSSFLRSFAPHLERAFDKTGVMSKKPGAPTLHLFFEDSGSVDIGLSPADDAAEWPMGIPRLRMPRAAPSRSTLKLAEAFLSLMNERERETSLRPGLRACDLGAAPGGWTLQLAERGLRVYAIDNGPIADAVLETGLVEHVRADGFTWRPPHKLDWMVCDMVEQPARVAALIGDWVASGRCRRSIFNLKLPMKKRFDEVQRCREILAERLADTGQPWVLRMRHLYHDREEITAYLGPAA